MGIVIKKFNKNNTPQSQIEESYNYNESLNVGNANGVRQDIIIKRDLSEDELEKEIISYMKSKGKILERKDIDYLLSRYFEVKDRNMWQAIVSFFSDMFNSIKALKHADYGDIEKPEEYAVIIDTAMHRFLGANMYPFLKSLITFFTIFGSRLLVGMVLIMINVWLFLFLVGPLALIEITLHAANIISLFKNLKKTRMILLDVCYQIDGTILEMRRNGGDEVEIDALEQVKKKIMKNNLITQKGFEKYKNRQLGIMESADIKLIKTTYGFEGKEAVERRIQQKILEYHIPLIEEYMDFNFENFDDGFSVDKSEDVPSY